VSYNPGVEQDSPEPSAAATSTRECRAVFVGSRMEGQLSVNETVVHIWVFTMRRACERGGGVAEGVSDSGLGGRLGRDGKIERAGRG
jgi:hypothetical protein